VCKYAVPEGYPDAPLKNIPISIAGVKDKQHLFLGAVDQTHNGLVATGSRTAAYVGVAATLPVAESIAEREISAIEGRLFHREDIGTAALVQSRIAMMHAVRMRSCA
jgi:phosphoribosylamine--glycine ligase